jgi:hypothetical protein
MPVCTFAGPRRSGHFPAFTVIYTRFTARLPGSVTISPDRRVETMGVRPTEQGSTLEDGLSHLLYELCVDWGHCIPSADAKRIASTKSLTADQFAHAVLTAEGFVAEHEMRRFEQIRQRFVDRFGQEIRAED